MGVLIGAIPGQPARGGFERIVGALSDSFGPDIGLAERSSALSPHESRWRGVESVGRPVRIVCCRWGM